MARPPPPPPPPPPAPGVYITNATPVRDFLAAVDTPYTRVVLAHDLVLDLTAFANIRLTRGVTLLGEAPPSPAQRGPLVYTNGSPHALGSKALFLIPCEAGDLPNDGVRMAGFRLYGPSFDQQTADNNGIQIERCVDIEITHMEIAGWGNAAIAVHDDPGRDGGRRVDPTNGPGGRISQPSHVRIQRNYIHHNQHPSDGRHTAGYGVDVGNGAWATITNNVFDFNRHAIAGNVCLCGRLQSHGQSRAQGRRLSH